MSRAERANGAPAPKLNGLVRFSAPDNGEGPAETRGERNMAICAWCSNRLHDVCVGCQAEGRYRHLVPELPEAWELPPSPPLFRQLVDLPAAERLALLYLTVWYLDWQNKRE